VPTDAIEKQNNNIFSKLKAGEETFSPPFSVHGKHPQAKKYCKNFTNRPTCCCSMEKRKSCELSAPFSMLLQQLGNLQHKTGSLNFN
jgi:hypothetical protein